MTGKVHDVAIVGGGLTGAVTAIHLARLANAPLSIAIIEPSADLGRGLAYSNPETEHRLNGPSSRHSIYPESLSHFHEWYLAEGLDEKDPSARDTSGYLFPRRYDFGTYLSAEMQKHMAHNPSGSDIVHIRDQAVDLEKSDLMFRIKLLAGETIQARVLVVAATPGKANIPRVLSSLSTNGPVFFSDPWDTERLRKIPKKAEVLILGMAQTASDVAASLLKYDHTGAITFLSRRGIRPRKRPPLDDNSYVRDAESDNMRHAQFLAPNGALNSTSSILHELRRDARSRIERGESWVPTMEKLSNLISDYWHALPLAGKRRFLRHSRTWYDVHRFRLPPQVETRIDAAMDRGQLSFLSAKIIDAEQDGPKVSLNLRERGQQDISSRTFDIAINCTGLEEQLDQSNNPFLNALTTRGFASRHATGSGYDVDPLGHSISPDGHVNQTLFIVGPLTYGAFADQQGSRFITKRALLIAPEILREVYAT